MKRIVALCFVGISFLITFGIGSEWSACPETYEYDNIAYYKTDNVTLVEEYRMSPYYYYKPFYHTMYFGNGNVKSCTERRYTEYVGDIYYPTRMYDVLVYEIIYHETPSCTSPIGSSWNNTTSSCTCPEEMSDIDGSCTVEGNTTEPESNFIELSDGKQGECQVNSGSYIIPKFRSFNDDYEIKGTSLLVHYSSARVSGYKRALYPFDSLNVIANGCSLSNVHYFDKVSYSSLRRW